VLRLALRQAHDLKLMRDDPRGLIPRFSVGYAPRDRYLTADEVAALLRELGPHRIPWVLVAVSTSGPLSEVEQLRWEVDVDLAGGWLLLLLLEVLIIALDPPAEFGTVDQPLD